MAEANFVRSLDRTFCWFLDTTNDSVSNINEGGEMGARKKGDRAMVLVLPLNKKSDWARTFVEAVNTPFGAALTIVFSFAVGAGLSIFFPPSDFRSPMVPAFDRAAPASTASISAPPRSNSTVALVPASDAAARASAATISAPPRPHSTAALVPASDAAARASTASVSVPPSPTRTEAAAPASTAPVSVPPPPIRADAAAPASTEPVSAPPPPIRADAAAPASTEPISVLPSPTPAASSPAALVSVPPRPNSTSAMLDRQAQLFKRGADFLKDGNVAAARLMLRSVADAGSAQAALLLGATYDPIILANLGVRGLEPDRVAAITWYRRAQEYAASEASGQIASGRIERLTETDR